MRVQLLTANDIERVLDMAEAIDVVEDVFRHQQDEDACLPPKVYIDLPEFGGDIRAMPAYLPYLNAAGMKWVSVHRLNEERGLPSVHGVLILNDPATGLPQAVMDGMYITGLRTGAAGAVAARHLARPDSATLALVGCGVQAQAQLDGLSRVFSLDEARVWGSLPEHVDGFLDRVKHPQCKLQPCATVKECVEGADIVVTATPSREPLVRREWLKDGAHINAIGSSRRGQRELAADVLRNAKIVVDDWVQAAAAGEIEVPVTEGWISRDSIHGTLSDVVTGRIPGRETAAETTVFDATGTALEDLACAAVAYRRCIERGYGTELQLG